jgi:deoxyadenosine/deoxycytidine kinase
MIVEFVGSTGAGKTTLISEVQRRLTEVTKVDTAFDLVADMLGLQRVANPTLQNLTCDLIGFPFFIRSLYRHKAFILFTLKILAGQANFTFFTISYLRSIARKIGTYEIIRRYKNDRIILVDEGTVLAAHNLFVYNSTVYSSAAIAQFASLVPLPELIVYVKAPLNSLVQRSLQRGDPPREMRSKNPELVKRYVGRAGKMFEQLVETKEIRNRVLMVENPTCTDNERSRVVDQIAKFILTYQSPDERVSITSSPLIESVSKNNKRYAI